MVCKCNKCGWRGINLKPDEKNDQALCPSCGAVFKGIPAKYAVRVSPEEEQQIMNHCII